MTCERMKRSSADGVIVLWRGQIIGIDEIRHHAAL
jgi:hypothetical protein